MAYDNQFDIPDFFKPFDFAGQKQENQNWINDYTSAIPRVRSASEAAFGLPQLRESYLAGNQNIANLQNTLFNIPNTVKQTSTNSLLNEGQRQRLVTAQGAPIERALSQLMPAQANLGQTLNMYEGLSSARTAMELDPYAKSYDLMTQRQAREMTGWSEQNQTELTRLIQNQQAGLTWTNAEAQRANQLALQEMQYKLTMDQLSKQQDYQKTQNQGMADLFSKYFP